MKRGIKIKLILFLTIFSIVSFGLSAQASTTNGTIDSTNKYVWGSKIGWINFGATNGNVAITDSAITGYVWSENYGWINLSPSGSGITNDSEGNLSGSAWGENLGWVDFSSVVINSSGKFTGTATGDVVGTINFDCSTCNVSTDWRPASTRSSGSQTTVTTGGGGSAAPFTPSPATYSILINNGDEQTSSSTVSIKLIGDSSTTFVWVSETSDLTPAKQVNYFKGEAFTLYTFDLAGSEGLKTIYAKFCNQQGYCGAVVTDTINYKKKDVVTDEKTKTEDVTTDTSNKIIDKTQSTSTSGQTDDKTVVEKITDTIKKITDKVDLIIPDFLKNWGNKDKELSKEETKKFVSQSTPLAMNNKWKLLPPGPIKQYVFAPLPEQYRALAIKIPALQELFSQTNVNNYNDLKKLANTEIQLPSLSKIIGLTFDQTQSEKQLAINDLSTGLKAKIPTDMVFVRGPEQLVDFGTVLSMSVDGLPVQKLRTVSGRKLSLAIRPKYKAKTVTGYLTFISRDLQNTNVVSWLEKLKLIDNVQATEVKDEMVLQTFTYDDADNDGIYTAQITAPVAKGDYEILTVIDYFDSQRNSKLVRLVAVVDPEGYVYEKVNNKELRIPSAVVSLHWLNPQTKKYQLWPADKFKQHNSQITDKSGTYSFLVPAGSYYLTAVAPGYSQYTSASFKVTDGLGVHLNIELQSKKWWLIIMDYKVWVIVLLSVILLYILEQEIKLKINNKKQTNFKTYD